MYKSLDTVYLEKIFGSIHKQANVARIPRFLIPKPKKVTLTSMSYDDVIEKAFKDNLQELNDIKGIDLKSTKITPVDRSVWFKLFELSPPKKNETEGSTKGSGFGELAIYWFLKKTNPSIQDNRYSKIGAADMVIGDVGIEVKAYPIGAINMAKKLSTSAQGGMFFNRNPQQKMDKVYGDMLSKISKRISDITNKI